MPGPPSSLFLAGLCLALGAPLAAEAAPKAPAKPAVAPGKKPQPKPAAPAPYPPSLRVLPGERRIELEAVVAKRNYDDVLKGAIEYLLVASGGKAYEAVFQTEVKADALDRALRQLGLKPGGPPADEKSPPTGPGLKIEVAWKDADGKEQRVPVEEMILDLQTGKPLSGLHWTYTGSQVTEDPATNKPVLMALQTNNLVSTHREDRTVLLMNPLKEASGKRYKRNEERLPKAGGGVRLIFSPAQ